MSASSQISDPKDKSNAFAFASSEANERLPSSLIAIFLVVTVDIMGFSIIIPLLPFYAQHFGGSAFAVGALLSLYFVCQLLAGPALGQMSDRIGRKPVLILSQAGTFCSFILLALSRSLWLVFAARALDGLTSGNISVAQAYVSDNTSVRQRTQAFGLISAAVGLGMLIGPAISGFLASKSLQAPILAAAVLSFASIAATVAFLPNSRPPAKPRIAPRILPLKAIVSSFSAPQTAALFILLALFYLAFSTFISGLALFLSARFSWHGHAFNAQNAGLVFCYAGFINLVIQTLFLKRVTAILTDRGALPVEFFLMGLGYLALTFSSNIPLLVVSLTLSNVGGAFLRPILTSQVSKRVSPEKQGMAMGVNQAIQAMMSIAAPLLAGLILSLRWYSTWAVWTAAIAFAGFGAAVALKPLRSIS